MSPTGFPGSEEVQFTFHNVSINSAKEYDDKVMGKGDLHSTMFLLIPEAGSNRVLCRNVFSFPNLSINS